MLERFQSFMSGITTCYKYIQRIKSMEMTELGLRGTHTMCLFYLHYYPEGLTATQLSQLCEEDKAAISRTLAELQSRGYIRPKYPAEKKYRSVLELTEAGKAVVQQFDGLIETWVCAGSDGLTEQEREDFHRVLGHIAANLRDAMEMKKE